MPALLRDAEVIDDSFQPLLARDRAVVERAPDRLPTAPRRLVRLQLAEERVERIVRLADRAVLGNHVGHAGVDEKPRAVAVVAGDVADRVDVAALRPADGGRPRGIELAREFHEIAEQ